MSFHDVTLHRRIETRIQALNLLVHGKATVPRWDTSARGPAPRRLELGVSSQAVCRAVNVSFKAKGATRFAKQNLCTVADVDGGFIKRYKKTVFGQPRKETETLYGEVRITWK